MTRLFDVHLALGEHTQIKLGGEVDEYRGKGSKRAEGSECRGQHRNCDPSPWLVSSLAAALVWPAGVGEPQAGSGVGKGRRTAEQAILFPPQPSCHLPSTGALVSRTKLHVLGWSRRLLDKTGVKKT